MALSSSSAVFDALAPFWKSTSNSKCNRSRFRNRDRYRLRDRSESLLATRRLVILSIHDFDPDPDSDPEIPFRQSVETVRNRQLAGTVWPVRVAQPEAVGLAHSKSRSETFTPGDIVSRQNHLVLREDPSRESPPEHQAASAVSSLPRWRPIRHRKR